jgi:hypothetical protein
MAYIAGTKRTLEREGYTRVVNLDSTNNEVTLFLKMERYRNIENPDQLCEGREIYKLVYNYKKNTYSMAKVDTFPVINEEGNICEKPDLPVPSQP